MQRETLSSPARDTSKSSMTPTAMAERILRPCLEQPKKAEWDYVPTGVISTFPATAACFDFRMRIRTGWLTDRRNGFLELAPENMAAMPSEKDRMAGFI